MLHRSSILLVALLAACPRPIAPAVERPTTPAVERSQAPAVHLPSRARDTDARGFYAEPAGLEDDFPAEGTAPDRIRRDFETARAAGARYLRFAVGWDSAEPAAGRYDWRLLDQAFQAARESGVIPLPYVCATPKWLSADPKDYRRKPPDDPKRFGEFMEAVSRRYGAPSWELWNEPDDEQSWLGSPEQFAALVRSGAEGVHRGDPRARVVLGGMAKGRTAFLDQTLRATADVIDVVNLHGEPPDARRAEEYPRSIGEVADAVRKLAPRADLWLAGFGSSDRRPAEASSAVKPDQAVALLRAHALALGTGLLSLTTWCRVEDLP
ncbi:MAG: beta-galactosidase, partial [Deltaproteobacteria bacterium]